MREPCVPNWPVRSIPPPALCHQDQHAQREAAGPGDLGTGRDVRMRTTARMRIQQRPRARSCGVHRVLWDHRGFPSLENLQRGFHFSSVSLPCDLPHSLCLLHVKVKRHQIVSPAPCGRQCPLVAACGGGSPGNKPLSLSWPTHFLILFVGRGSVPLGLPGEGILGSMGVPWILSVD